MQSDEITNATQFNFGGVIYANKSDEHHISVYQGTTLYGAKIAIKMYKSNDLTKLKNEVDLLRYLSNRHKGFIKFYGSFIQDSTLYIIMEYCDKTLGNYISSHTSEGKCIDLGEYEKMLLALVDIFAELESLNIYHRDIKPMNILIDERGNMKVIDFSISKYLPQPEDPNRNYQYDVIGTKSYMSPELSYFIENNYKSASYNLGKSDVYSLGLVLLSLASLITCRSFNANNHEEITECLQQIEDDFHRHILETMLRFDANQRPSFTMLNHTIRLQILSFPVGEICMEAQLNPEILVSQSKDGIFLYEGTTFTGDKVFIKLFNSTIPIHVAQARYLVCRLQQLSCKTPSFCRFYGAFEERGFIWVVYENANTSLQSFLTQRRNTNQHFNDKQKFAYFNTLASILIYCHNLNIEHNSIRADNFYYDSKGNIKIVGFNIPYLERKEDKKVKLANIDEYLAPEIIEKLRQPSAEGCDNKKADIFSLGLVWYEIVTLESINVMKLNTNIPFLEAKVNNIQEDWVKYILKKMLEKDPVRRADSIELQGLIEHFSKYLG